MVDKTLDVYRDLWQKGSLQGSANGARAAK
jgi:hypothetical protein